MISTNLLFLSRYYVYCCHYPQLSHGLKRMYAYTVYEHIIYMMIVSILWYFITINIQMCLVEINLWSLLIDLLIFKYLQKLNKTLYILVNTFVNHDQLKLRPCFLPWVWKNRRYRILKEIDRLGFFLLLNLEAWNLAGVYKIENK